MGLGSARSVSLALAREFRDDCHVKLARGLDPIEARNTAALAARAERAKQMTFRQCVEDYLAVNASKWRNAKHRKEGLATLTHYAYQRLAIFPLRRSTADSCSRTSSPWSPTNR
jgi:hypothetical protein